jgi:uncharacterized protein YegL
MARKLPVYILVDTSGSMHGEPIEAVKNGLQIMAAALKQDPQALETAQVSIITFGPEAKQVVPMCDLQSFQPPDLKAGGSTPLGDALSLLYECANREIVKSTPDKKGDWKPMVFVMTDGMPDSGWESGLQKFKQGKWGVVCGVGIGGNYSEVLGEICGTPNNVLCIQDADQQKLATFFKWVTGSITTSSARIDSNQGEATSISQLPPPPQEFSL